MSDPVTQATFELDADDLPRLVLTEIDLPDTYGDYRSIRDGGLDNRTMAEHGFAGATEERFREIGRIDGFLREFGPPPPPIAADGIDFVVASVAHLFRTPDSVHDWMHEVFLSDFVENVGNEVGDGQTLVGLEQIEPRGFYDEAVGLKTLHDSSGNMVSSTVIDFRVGRILGVVFVATVGDHLRLGEATELGIAMEKQIVSVALGAS